MKIEMWMIKNTVEQRQERKRKMEWKKLELKEEIFWHERKDVILGAL